MSERSRRSAAMIPDSTTTPEKSPGGVTIAGTPPTLPSLSSSTMETVPQELPPLSTTIEEALPSPKMTAAKASAASMQPPSTKTGFSSKGTAEKSEVQKKRRGKAPAEKLSIDDLLLPRSTILRLAKEAVPDKLSMHKDAVLAINRATTVFISSLAHNANLSSKRRTIKSEDVYDGLGEMEFEWFIPQVQKETDVYVARTTEHQEKLKRDKINREEAALQNYMKAKEASLRGSAEDSLEDLLREDEMRQEREKAKRIKREPDDDESQGVPQFDGAGSGLSSVARQRADAAREQAIDLDGDANMSEEEEDEEFDDQRFGAEVQDDDDDDIDNDPNIVVVGSEDDERGEYDNGGRRNRRGQDEELDDIPVEDLDGHSRRKRVINPDYAGDDDDDNSDSD